LIHQQGTNLCEYLIGAGINKNWQRRIFPDLSKVLVMINTKPGREDD